MRAQEGTAKSNPALRLTAPKPFDLDAAAKDILVKYGQFTRFERLLVSEAIEIGKRLIEIKAQLGHGGWLPFVTDRLKWTPLRAQRFMNAAEYVGTTNPDLASVELTQLYTAAYDWKRSLRQDEDPEGPENDVADSSAAVKFDTVSNLGPGPDPPPAPQGPVITPAVPSGYNAHKEGRGVLGATRPSITTVLESIGRYGKMVPFELIKGAAEECKAGTLDEFLSALLRALYDRVN